MRDNWKDLVKHYRMRHGLSQTEMARMMDVSQRTISRWERGEDNPGIQFKKRLRDLALEPPEVFLRALIASVKHCPAPRALSRFQNLELIAVSQPAILKRPSIEHWIGKNLTRIASGLLQQMLDDHDLQRSISSGEIVGITTVAGSVLDTRESAAIAKYRTTISYFFHEGVLYSDAISAPANADEPEGFTPLYADDVILPLATS